MTYTKWLGAANSIFPHKWQRGFCNMISHTTQDILIYNVKKCFTRSVKKTLLVFWLGERLQFLINSGSIFF